MFYSELFCSKNLLDKFEINIMNVVFWGALRVWPEFLHLWKTHGIQYTYCNNDLACDMIGCWSAAFIMSKVAELLDTAFIILRKQNLTFLHWYHHASVLIYCWWVSLKITQNLFLKINFLLRKVMHSRWH